MSKKILVVAFDYPPITGGAALRVQRLVKGFLKNGAQVHTLTVSNPQSTGAQLDRSLDVPGKVTRSWSLELAKLLPPSVRHSAARRKYLYFMPCPHIGFFPLACIKAHKIAVREGIDLIYTPYPIPSNLFVGYWVKKTTGKKWVIDMHDSWYAVVKEYLPSRAHRWIWKWLEGKMLRAADKIAVTTEQIKKDILSHHKIQEDKFFVLPQVVDMAEMEKIKETKSEKFRIAYVGALSDSQTIIPLVQAANALGEKIEVIVAGPENKEMINEAQRADKKGLFKYAGYVPVDKSIELMKSADVLFVSLAHDEKFKYACPSKIFDYCAAGKPVLGFLPEGEAAKFINENKVGLAVTDGKIESLARALKKLIEDEKLRAQFAENALKSARKFDAVHAAQKILKMI